MNDELEEGSCAPDLNDDTQVTSKEWSHYWLELSKGRRQVSFVTKSHGDILTFPSPPNQIESLVKSSLLETWNIFTYQGQETLSPEHRNSFSECRLEQGRDFK